MTKTKQAKKEQTGLEKYPQWVVRLDHSLRDACEVARKSEDRTRSAFIRQALRHYLQRGTK